MKELNEYKQEIFRRSQEKKRQIRIRRRIALGVGIPLCLCCVLTLAMIPYLHPGVKGDFAPSMESACDSELSNQNGVQTVFRITDPTDAAMVQSVLEGETPEYSLSRDPACEENTLADQAQPGEYLLMLSPPEGDTVCYRITGPEAYCETTGETVLLTEAQAEMLYYFLLTQLADGV